MTAVLSADQTLSFGFKARRLRVSQLLTQRELANIAGTSQEDVSLLEHDLPVRLDAKRKLLRELWARKAGKRQIIKVS